MFCRPGRRPSRRSGATMEREILTEEHHAFRDLVRTFISREITPHYAQWERDGAVDRSVWTRAGACGLLGIDVDPCYGGGGSSDYRFHAVLAEEFARAGVYAP